MCNEIPYCTYAEAIALKEIVQVELSREDLEGVYNPMEERDIVVPCQQLLSLIHQAHSPQLGFATTKQLRDELAARDKDEISRQDNYKTFNPQMEVTGDGSGTALPLIDG